MNARPARALALALVLAACAATEQPTGGLVGAAPSAPPSASPSAPLVEVTPPPGCVNPPPDVATLIAQDERVACYGSAELTVEARAMLLHGAIDCPGGLEPAWLACGVTTVELHPLEATVRLPAVVLAARSPLGEWLHAVIHPSYDIDLTRGLDMPVRATGHFDDPAARDCQYTSGPGTNPPPSDEVVRGCQSTFVITRLEPLDLEAATEAAVVDGPSS